MATWQFDFHLIPRKKLLALFGEMPSSLDEETFNTVEWWKDSPLPADYENIIASFLPGGKSWSPNLRMWGEEDGNRMDIFNDVGYMDSIFVRVDVRTHNDQFLEGIIKFADYIDAVIVTEEDRVIEPRLNALVIQILESNAYRFVKDPQEFFESIRKGEIKFRGFE